MQHVTVGRIVNFVFKSRTDQLDIRPAIVVRVWNQEVGMVNLQVFTDNTNDVVPGNAGEKGLWWATSVHYADPEELKPYTWHWPEQA